MQFFERNKRDRGFYLLDCLILDWLYKKVFLVLPANEKKGVSGDGKGTKTKDVKYSPDYPTLRWKCSGDFQP